MKQVDPGVECSLYVDDFVIMYKSPTIDAIQRKLQHTINRLEEWTLKNGFTISKNKTVAMHFCPLNGNVKISIKISLGFVPKGTLGNKSALVQVTAWRQTGDKPLLEPILTQFTDTYMWH